MKRRAVLFVALAIIAGVFSILPPAHAGPYIVKVHFACKLKMSGPLMYPSLQNSPNLTWSFNCGKGKPKNPTGGNQHGILDETFCQADLIPANTLLGQPDVKPVVTKGLYEKPSPPKGILPSSCRINTKLSGVVMGPAPGVGPSCRFSAATSGIVNLAIHTSLNSATQKTFDMTISWFGEVGGAIVMSGSFVKKGTGGGSGPLSGATTWTADRLHKNATCTPPGTTQFKIVGTLVGIGVKP